MLERSCRLLGGQCALFRSCPGDQSSENIDHNPSDTSISLLQNCDPAQSENLQKCSQVMPEGPGATPRLALLKLRQKVSSSRSNGRAGVIVIILRRRLPCRSACWVSLCVQRVPVPWRNPAHAADSSPIMVNFSALAALPSGRGRLLFLTGVKPASRHSERRRSSPTNRQQRFFGTSSPTSSAEPTHLDMVDSTCMRRKKSFHPRSCFT